jgi:hypothetical protein
MDRSCYFDVESGDYVCPFAIVVVAAYLLGEFYAGSGLIFAVYSALAFIAVEAILTVLQYVRPKT